MDTTILFWIHENVHFDAFFRSITVLGNGWFLTTVVVLTALAFLFRFRLHKSHIILLAGISSSIFISIFKHIFSRPRPQLWPHMVSVGPYGFPSGHALGTIVIYGIIAIFFAEAYPKRRGIIYAFFGSLIFLIGLSRLYLGVHWPSDIIGGWIIGGALLAALYWWYKVGGIGRLLRIGIGSFALALGLIGLVIPIIPGIPFIIIGIILIFSSKTIAEMFGKKRME